MEAVVLQVPAEAAPGWLPELADEMLEDARCHLVVLGADDGGAMLVTIWDSEVADEVATSLRAQAGDGAIVRKLALVTPAAER